jgi:adenosine deaminase
MRCVGNPALDVSLARLPKAELRCHIEGTMRYDTAFELARKNGVPLPDPAAGHPAAPPPGATDMRTLSHSVLRTRQDWALVAYESVIDGAEAGVVYREASFTPARHLAAGQRLVDIIAGLHDGLTAAEKETGATCPLILELGGDGLADPRGAAGAGAVELVESLIELRRRRLVTADRVIGVGVGTESPFVARDGSRLTGDIAAACQLAARSGLHVTARVNGGLSPRAISLAVERLGCERIDHGAVVLEDGALLRAVVAKRIAFTLRPSALAPDTFGALRRAGVRATICTGEPALSGFDLTGEYARVAVDTGASWADMVAIALDAVDASWMGADDRAALRSRLLTASSELAPAA